ncbi:phage adaptor protein [Psychrobacter sp.]|uniref:phage adaptor protein n=1 Tax=Psychrobacter sp. TaxID=56811 RepID=UPI002FDB5F45
MFSSQDLLNGMRMTQLNDPDATTWSDATLIIALNEALRMLILFRPDASAKIATIDITEGSRQLIPENGVRLLRVVRNISALGESGRAVRLVQQEDMDSMSPDWHNAAGTIVKEYMFDSRSPKHFYIYPTVPTASKLEIEYSSYADEVTELTVNNPLPVSPIFAQPVQELMLYKLLSGDSSNGASGADHLRVGLELLGIKDTADERVSSARRTST